MNPFDAERLLQTHLKTSLDIIQLFGQPKTAFWIAGQEEGLYTAYNITPGLKMDVGLRMWSPRLMGPTAVERHRQMVRYVIDAFDLKRVGATIAVGNTLSRRLIEKLGFKEEGLLRNWAWVGDVMSDFIVYSALPEEVL